MEAILCLGGIPLHGPVGGVRYGGWIGQEVRGQHQGGCGGWIRGGGIPALLPAEMAVAGQSLAGVLVGAAEQDRGGRLFGMAEVVPGSAAHRQPSCGVLLLGLHAGGEGVHVERHACFPGERGRVGVDEALLVEDMEPRVHGVPAFDSLGVLGLPGAQSFHEGGIQSHGGQGGPGDNRVSAAEPQGQAQRGG